MRNKNIGFVAGIWDGMHRGHLNLLRAIRDANDHVVVIIHDDLSCYKIKDKLPIQSLERRIANLQTTKLADEIIVTYDVDPWREFNDVIVRYGSFNLRYMRGDDLTSNFPAQWLLEKMGTPIEYLPYTQDISSTLIAKELWK